MRQGLLPWLRMMLAVGGGLLVAFASIIAAVAVLAGVAWIFLFGDNPWPEWANAAIMTIALVFAAIAGFGAARSIWHSTRPSSV